MRISDWSSDVCSSDLDTFGAFVRFSDGETFPNFDTLRDGVDRTFDIKQLEAGLKYTSDHVRLYATGYRNTNERFQSTLGADDATAFTTRAYGLDRSAEHTSELQTLMRYSYAVFCLKKK